MLGATPVDSPTPPFPPCPFLPEPPAAMDAGALTALGDDRGPRFYLTVLTYGAHLWRRGHAARAVLCLDRALGADLRGDEPELAAWPPPYAALVWFLRHTPADVFLGNPRVHFQHYADRMNAPRREARQARAWACWALTRAARPEFPGDPRHRVVEPDLDAIAAALSRHGWPGEAALWRSVLDGIAAPTGARG